MRSPRAPQSSNLEGLPEPEIRHLARQVGVRRNPSSAASRTVASSLLCPATQRATPIPGRPGPPAQSRSPRATSTLCPRQPAVRRPLRAVGDVVRQRQLSRRGRCSQRRGPRATPRPTTYTRPEQANSRAALTVARELLQCRLMEGGRDMLLERVAELLGFTTSGAHPFCTQLPSPTQGSPRGGPAVVLVPSRSVRVAHDP